MRIVLHIAWHDQELVRTLNFLARIGARQLRADPSLPLLRDSGVIYQREREETFRDVIEVLKAGEEDCDSLSAYDAAEKLARGWRALRPHDPGFEAARRARLSSIKAEVYMVSRTAPNQPGPAHAVVRYQVGGVWHACDPSAQLGMNNNTISPDVWARWQALGIRDQVVNRWAARGVDLREATKARRAS